MAKRVAELEVLVTANTGQAKRELDSVSRSFHNIIAGGALLGAGGGILGWFKDAITSGAAFEQTMIRVQQLATGTEVSVDALTKKAFAVDQATIYSAQQIAEAMEQLGREGFTGEQILGSWTDAAVNFAAVINEDLVSATNIFGQVARVFKDENLSAAETANILSQAILRSGRPAAEFATGMQYIGSIAAQFGASLDETATSLSYLQSLGIKGRSAGTGIRSMFIELAAGADEFGMSHGVQAFDPVTGAFVGIPSIIDQFGELISTMSKADALSFLSDIFGKPASSPLFALFSGGTEAYEEHRQKMEDLGSAATFMRTLMDTIAGSLDRFEAAASNAMRKIGVIAGTMIKPFLDMFTAMLGAFTDAPRIVHIATVAFLAFAAAMATLTGAFMLFKGLGGFALLASGLKIFALSSLGVLGVIGALVIGFIAFKDELSDIKNGVVEVLGPIMDLFDYLSRIDQGNNPLEFLVAQGWDGALLTFAEGLGDVVEGLADLWYFISRGDWDRFMRRLPGELEQMWNGVRLAFSVVPEILGFDNWEDLVIEALAWTGENLVLDPITAVIEGSINLLGDLGNAAGNLWGWVKGKLFGGDSPLSVDGRGNKTVNFLPNEDRTIPIGDVFITGAVKLGQGLAHIAGNLWGWLENKLLGGNVSLSNTDMNSYLDYGDASGVDVTGRTINLGDVLIDAALDLAETIWGEATDFAGWAKNKIEEVGDIFIPVEGVKIGLEGAILDITGGENEGEGTFFQSLGTQLGDLIANSQELITETGKGFGKLLSKAIQALSPEDLAESTVDWSNFGQNVGAWIHDAFITMTEVPTALITGIATFIGNAISELSLDDLKAIPGIGANVLAAIGGFLVGLFTGEDSSEWSFGEFSSKLGSKISEAISGAFDFLRSGDGGAGADAPTGLFDSMGEQIMAPDSFASSISDIIMEEIGKAFESVVTKTGELLSDLWPDGWDLPIPEISTDGFLGKIDDIILFIDEQIKRIQNAWDRLIFWEDKSKNPDRYIATPGDRTGKNDPNLTMVNNERDYDAIGAYPNAGDPSAQPMQVSVVPKLVDGGMDTLAREIETREFNATLKLDGIDGVMTDFAAAFDMGRAWASTEHESTAKLDILDVINNHIKAAQLATAWANSGPHTAYAHLNIEDVKTQANFAWSIGNQWDGTTFTASFSVDVSGLYAARDTAALVAQQIADMMPHSPAKEGPLKEPISFAYIADEFDLAADAIRTTSAALAGDVAAAVDMPYATGGRLDVQAPQVRNVTINNFALTANDLAKLQQDAENGKLIVSGAAYELDMTLGV